MSLTKQGAGPPFLGNKYKIGCLTPRDFRRMGTMLRARAGLDLDDAIRVAGNASRVIHTARNARRGVGL